MSTKRRLRGAIIRVFISAVLAGAAAAALRFALIERDDLGPVCDAITAPWWCELRMLVIHAFLNDVFGRASVAFAALALWRRSPIAAYLALTVGTWGMMLYNFTWSGVGVLGGALAVARLQGEWREDRQAE